LAGTRLNGSYARPGTQGQSAHECLKDFDKGDEKQ